MWRKVCNKYALSDEFCTKSAKVCNQLGISSMLLNFALKLCNAYIYQWLLWAERSYVFHNPVWHVIKDSGFWISDLGIPIFHNIFWISNNFWIFPVVGSNVGPDCMTNTTGVDYFPVFARFKSFASFFLYCSTWKVMCYVSYSVFFYLYWFLSWMLLVDTMNQELDLFPAPLWDPWPLLLQGLWPRNLPSSCAHSIRNGTFSQFFYWFHQQIKTKAWKSDLHWFFINVTNVK